MRVQEQQSLERDAGGCIGGVRRHSGVFIQPTDLQPAQPIRDPDAPVRRTHSGMKWRPCLFSRKHLISSIRVNGTLPDILLNMFPTLEVTTEVIFVNVSRQGHSNYTDYICYWVWTMSSVLSENDIKNSHLFVFTCVINLLFWKQVVIYFVNYSLLPEKE